MCREGLDVQSFLPRFAEKSLDGFRFAVAGRAKEKDSSFPNDSELPIKRPALKKRLGVPSQALEEIVIEYDVFPTSTLNGLPQRFVLRPAATLKYPDLILQLRRPTRKRLISIDARGS